MLEDMKNLQEVTQPAAKSKVHVCTRRCDATMHTSTYTQNFAFTLPLCNNVAKRYKVRINLCTD